VRQAPGDEQDGFIVVSFSNATLVFEIGEEVKETSDSGFLGTVATLHTQLLDDGSILQVRSRHGDRSTPCCRPAGYENHMT
jgi:splicing factor 3B subunit 3